MRHANITRHEVLVYNVQTWIDRAAVAENARVEGPPNDFLRIKPSLLRALAAVCSLMPLPQRLPPMYADVDDEEGIESEHREHIDDDPPAPIPEGFRAVEWSVGSGMLIKDVMLMIFTRLDMGRKDWHHALVTKHLMANARGGFTHGARFSDGVRGVQLTADSYNDGCWVPIRAVDSAITAASAAASGSHAHSHSGTGTPGPASARAPQKSASARASTARAPARNGVRAAHAATPSASTARTQATAATNAVARTPAAAHCYCYCSRSRSSYS